MEDETQARPVLTPVNLDDLSIDDLQERISALETEIAACKAVIDAKGDAKSAADAMFNFSGE